MRIRALLGLALMAGSASAADPTLLFSDAFDGSPSYDINLEADSGRQTGLLAPITYTESGKGDNQTQVNADDSPGKLRLETRGDSVIVSPDHNFTEGGTFSIEFDVDAGLNDPDGTSDDWAAIVFGATKSRQFVNGSDGMGILFRNNGNIQVFDGTAAIYGGDGGIPGGLPLGEVHVRIDVVSQNFIGSPATVNISVNGQPLVIAGTDQTSYTRAGGFKGGNISVLAYASAGKNWVSTFDNLSVSAVPCVAADPATVDRMVGDASPATITVTLPPGANAAGAVDLVITSRDPSVAIPAGAPGGSATLHFGVGDPGTATVDLVGVSHGRTVFDITGPAGICSQNSVQFTVRKAFIANPSFENNPPTAYPTYGPIDSWGGGTGINRDKEGPFADNGAIPDRHQVAHVQGSRTLSQDISGLDPSKRYLLQYRYNARGCCGNFNVALTPRFAGVDLETVSGITPVGSAGGTDYYYGSVAFTPVDAAGTLAFAATVSGDGTALLDAITIVQRDEGNVLVQNPSFEASGDPASPGYVSPASISGWQGTGGYGVNFSGGGPFADNGEAPDQDYAAFLQGQGSSLSQRLNGLVAGKSYSVSYAVNARSGNTPHLKVTAGDAVLEDDDVNPVGAKNPYTVKTASFIATGATATIKFEQTAAGDQTVLVDDVRVVGESINIPCIRVAPNSLQIGVGQDDATVTVTISSQLNATQDATVTVTTLDPTIAEPVGGVNGSLDLVFPAGGDTVQTFAVHGIARGTARLDLSNSFNLCFDNPRVNVSVVSSFVRNPSFENNYNPAFPGYGPIDAWTGDGAGNTGVNESTGPFHDNGTIPDRSRVALLQVNKSISQKLFNLVPGSQYWLQLRYNTRNCCGGTEDFVARLDGNDLTETIRVTPVGAKLPYNFLSVPFVPAAPTAVLELASITSGDATLLLDEVTVVQRDPDEIVIENPSFEASGIVPFPGYIQPAPLGGWVGSGGNYGVNIVGPGPFADNGVNPDQDSAAFLQGQGATLSQSIPGLTPGAYYELAYAYNARGGNTPGLRVTVDDAVIQDDVVTPVGGSNPFYSKKAVFQAASDTVTLSFVQTAAGDNTVVFDDVHIRPTTQPVTLVALPLPDHKVRVQWPASATGYKLQVAPSLPVGPWTDSTDAVQTDAAGAYIVTTADQAQRYYRLVKNQ
jgi:hypothetical protein